MCKEKKLTLVLLVRSLREAITNINNAATTYADCAPTGAYGTSGIVHIQTATHERA